MRASRFFSPDKQLKSFCLALSLGFMSAQFSLAVPEIGQSECGASSSTKSGKQASASKPDTPATEGLKPVSVDKKQNSDEKAKAEPAKEEKVEKVEKTEQPKAESAKTEKTEPETAAADPDTLHDQGLFHWRVSNRYLKEWDLDLAETELDLAVMSWPELKVAHRDLCLVSFLRFNLMRSIAEFMMTVGLGEPVPMSESESETLMEDAMVKHYKKGLVFARKEDWPKTANELQLAAHLAPEDYAVQRSLAYAYANLGNFDKAEKYYRRTFELAPNDGSSRADLAYFLAENGKLGEAQKELEAAVKSEPQTAAYHVDLAWMAESRGDLDTATKELQAALKLGPKHANLWNHLGRIYAGKGQVAEAMSAYNQALALDPKLVEAKESLSKLEASSSQRQGSAPI